MNKINNFLTSNINKILLIFLFSQPFIDILTAISINILKLDLTIGIIIRMIFMLFCIYYIFFLIKSPHKKVSVIYLIVLIIYMLLFCINILSLKGVNAISYEVKNLIKTFYFPITLVTIYNLYDEKKLTINTKTLLYLFVIYTLLVFIPNLLNIGFNSYEVTKKGEIGLFYTANEISAIISLLMPIFIYYLLKTKNIKLIIPFIIILLYVLTSMGTKGPLLCFIIIFIYYFIKLNIKIITEKKYKYLILMFLILITTITASLLIIPKTDFYKNICIHLDFLKVKKVEDIVKDPKKIDHFIFSQRLSFWHNTNNSYKNSYFSEKLLGIGYIENYSTDNVKTKMVEMDYVDIFYRHGLLGNLIFMLPYIYMYILIIKKITRKNLKNNLIQTLCISILFSMILSLLTGHVITSPSVSIYVSLLINILYNELGEKNYEKIRNSYC